MTSLEFGEDPIEFKNLFAQVQNSSKSLQSLSFGYEGVQFSQEDFGFLLKALNAVPKLTNLTLEIKDCSLQPGQIKEIFDQVSQMTNLEEFEFDISSNDVREEGATAIGQALANLGNLQKLAITVGLFTDIQSAGVVKICKGIEGLVKLEEFSLNFFNNDVGVEGMNSIGNLLIKLKALTNFSLALENCSIDGIKIKPFIIGLQSLTALTSITLCFKSNDLKADSIKELGYSLQQLKNIEEANLDFDYNIIQTEGAQSICTFINNWRELKKLELSIVENSLDKDAAKQLGSFAQLPKLEEFILQIGQNNQGPESAKYIGDALQQMKGLKVLTLNLNQEKIGDEGCKYICNGISALTELEIVFLKFCGGELQVASGQHIGSCLSKLTEIQQIKLDLSLNEQLGAQGILSIKQGIQGLKKLQEFTIQLNCKQDNKSYNEVHAAVKSFKEVHIEKTELQINGNTLSRKSSMAAGSKPATRQPSGQVHHSREPRSNQSFDSQGQKALITDQDKQIKSLKDKLETKNDILIAVIAIAVMVILLLGFLLICPKYRNLFSSQTQYDDDDDFGYGEGDLDDNLIDPKYFTSGSDTDNFEFNQDIWSD